MNIQTIHIKSFSDLDLLKSIILKDLNLFDVKKNSVDEFEQRLENYLSRNHATKLELRIHRDKIYTDLKLRLGADLYKTAIPDNYDIGNPLNRWIIESKVKTTVSLIPDKEVLTTKLNTELSILNDFLSSVEAAGNGQIAIIEI